MSTLVKWKCASALVLGLALPIWAVSSILEPEECDVPVHQVVPSPDGALSAIVFSVDCGATVGFNTQVSLAPAGHPFSRERSPAFLSLKGRHSLTVGWPHPHAVRIAIPADAQAYKRDYSAAGITVEYR